MGDKRQADAKEALRNRAEDSVREGEARLPSLPHAVTAKVLEATVHQLRVHQTELEMQNEELRKVQAELEVTRARYFDLYDLAPVGYCTINEAGVILEANLTAGTLLGVERSKLINRSLAHFILRDDQDLFFRFRKQLIEIGTTQVCELRLVKSDGALFWGLLTTSVVAGAAGVSVSHVVLTDITARKLQEESLALTAHLLVLLNSPGDYRQCMQDLTGTLHNWAGCEAVGIRLRNNGDYPYYATSGFPEEFVQKETLLCAYDATGQRVCDAAGNPGLECMCGLVITGRTNPSQPCFTANGSFWTNASRSLLELVPADDARINPRNQCIHAGYQSVALIPLRLGTEVFGLLQFNDHRPDRFTSAMITQLEQIANNLAIALARRQTTEALRENEQALQASRDLLSSIIDSTPSSVFAFDLDYRCTLVNTAAIQFHRRPKEEILGKTLHDIFTKATADQLLAVDREILTTGQMRVMEETLLTKLGTEPRTLLTAKFPIRDTHGKIVGLGGVATDITERKLVETELVAAHEELQQHAGQLEQTVSQRTADLQATVADLEAFAYSLSHDMRAPLRAVKSYIDLVFLDKGNQLTSTSTEYLGRISVAARRLDQLIQDVLLISRLSQRNGLQMETVDVEKLLRTVIAERPGWQPPAATIVIDSPLLPVQGHIASLSQCVTNLLTNAVKFVAPGVVPHVRIWSEAVEDSVRIWVEDNGIGISADSRSQLFKMFSRIPTPTAYDGTGIGLAIVWKAVSNMGGRVGVESEPGQGSRFWLLLPKGKG